MGVSRVLSSSSSRSPPKTLPQYLVPQEAEEFARFKAGETFPDIQEDGWTEQIRRHKTEGRTTGRVHIVTRPLSDYLRFEFARYYRHSVRAGEDIRILDVTERPNPPRPTWQRH